MELTEKITTETFAWDNFNDFTTSEEIFNFLNCTDNLCTPGFLLRRQIQIEFPTLVKEAAEKSNTVSYDDLTKSGNKPWPPEMVNKLARLLAKKIFKRYDEKNPLTINVQQWKNFLNDQSICQRESAIKLIFALNMDLPSAKKFLEACGHALFSLRNPFDYACLVCLECGATYAEAEALFSEFQSKRNPVDGNKKISDNDFTRKIKNETAQILGSDKISFDKARLDILKVMLENEDDFCRERKDSGFSIQNLERLRLLLKYLTELYPTVALYLNQRFIPNRQIATRADGTPKVPDHLTTAMVDYQKIPLPEYDELMEYDGPELPERGPEKRSYDNIPFTKNVLIPLRSLSRNLRAILRAMKTPQSAQAVDRNSLLLLTYFLITGWQSANQETKEKLRATLDKDSDRFEEDSPQSDLLGVLSTIFDGLDEIDENSEPRPKIYMSLLHLMLSLFDLSDVYPPFVLDRFILLCLTNSNNLHQGYLMSLVIEDSYQFSNELIN